MKLLFDPKWLPETMEAKVPVLVARTREELLEDIRLAVKTFREEPMVIADIARFCNHIHLLGPDGLFHYSHTVDLPPGAYGPGFGNLPQLDITKFVIIGDYNVPKIELAEEDPKKKNKIARKKRDANKASQNARGRKWWEHR